MHDCNGRPLGIFNRVRPATEAELRAKGYEDSPIFFDGERTVISVTPRAQTCNARLVSGVGAPVTLLAEDGQSGVAIFATQGPFVYATARTLIRVD